jgi:hypothetical protein
LDMPKNNKVTIFRYLASKEFKDSGMVKIQKDCGLEQLCHHGCEESKLNEWRKTN